MQTRKKYTRLALFFITNVTMINFSFLMSISLTLNNIIEVVKNK